MAVDNYYAQIQMDDRDWLRLSATQQQIQQQYTQRELERQLLDEVRKNIKFEKRRDSMSPYSSTLSACFGAGTAGTTDGSWRYQGQYAATTNGYRPAPKPSETSKPILTFYEKLKAEIDGWLSGVKADLCLT